MDVGVEFEHYRVIEHIGRGGMADVWSARDKRLNRVVAVKTVARDLTLENDPIQMFEREAKTIAGLEHPHILPVYDFGDYDRQLYIVMRYISGGSLDDVLEQGAMQPDAALAMARAIASALDHAHKNNVVHLDLKPSNILLDTQGQPYLADFGLAAVMDREGQAQNPGSGTLLYMAPEQVTSDVLDHRADVYSFCILLFHLFSGTLPFDGTMPLALQQLQLAEEMPDISTVQFGLPYALTELLRHGTHVDPLARPASVRDITDALGSMFDPGKTSIRTRPAVERVMSGVFGNTTQPLTTLPLDTTSQTMPLDTPDELARREAIEIYNKARRAWAFGQGRFVLGITDFTLINDYYSAAETHKLELDDAGKQMLLRGALEYDYQIEAWWAQVNDEGRRWVALHALRGQNAAARVRALERLVDLPDADPPQIPKLVAQTLQMENHRPAKLAAIRVLRERAKIGAETPRIEFGGDGKSTRALSQTASVWLTTRLKLWTPGDWREVVYSPEIDTLLATLALDGSDKVAAQSAARAIGHVRSKTALNHIAGAQKKGVRGALRALALIRDEAPSLPGVSGGGRIYTWWANTVRRLSDNPMQIVWRFIWAFLGGALGMGYYVWNIYTAQALFEPSRWKDTVSIALFFGASLGITVILGSELPLRLRGFWTWWARLLLSMIVSIPLAMAVWALYTYLFLNYPPDWAPLIPAGIGMALGLILSAVYRLPGWLLAIITAVGTFVPLYTAYQAFVETGSAAVLYARPDTPEQIFTLGLPVAILVALGAFFQPLYRELRALTRRRAT
jgi:serine/threonine protein kinase